MKIFGIDFEQKSETDPVKPECLHANMQEVGEGVRFCRSCKTIERLEKNKFPEAGEPAWKWRKLSKDEALRVQDDLKTRMNS